jgi:hypothetical protein
MEGFEGLASAFDVGNDEEDFKKAVLNVEKDIKLIEVKKEDIINQSKVPTLFKNQEFIQTELRSLIMSARTIMYKVEQDIKIGTDSRKIEVYAKLVEAIGKQYVSLIELDKHIFEAQVLTNTVDIGNIGSNKISLSSDQLLDMIIKAGEGSQMNAIEAKFEIESENIPIKKFKKDEEE